MTERRRNWVCPKGHLYAKTGAYRNGTCKACAQARSRRSNRVSWGIADATDETRRGPCQICGRLRRLVLDHDHQTGRIRGWICSGCNRSLVALDMPGWLKKAQNYLKKEQ